MTRHTPIRSVLGTLTAVEDAGRLIGLYFPGHWTNPDRSAWGPQTPATPLGEQLEAELAGYLAGERRAFGVPVELRGNAFQQRVWALLREIPYGETTSYGELAAAVGVRNAQLVGQAVGHNPVSIVVPCHRVVAADGRLTGYAGGLERKAFLLDLEGNQPGLDFAAGAG